MRYIPIPWDQFEQRAGHEITLMYRWFQEVGYHADIAAVRQRYPRLTSLEQWVQAQDWEQAGAGASMRAR